MRVIVEFRKPSKRMIWKLKRLDRWLDKNMPPFLTTLSGALLMVGFIALVSVIGTIEYGEALSDVHVKILIGGIVSMLAGTALGVYLGKDANYEDEEEY